MLTRFSSSVCRNALVCLLFCAAFVTVSASSVSAQTQPPISPLLSMFNYNRGGAQSNYHAFVVPQQKAIQTFQAQERQIQSQGRQIQAQSAQQRSLQDEVGGVLNAPRQVGSIGGAKGAGYRQYLHYYQGLPQGGVPSYATGRR